MTPPQQVRCTCRPLKASRVWRELARPLSELRGRPEPKPGPSSRGTLPVCASMSAWAPARSTALAIYGMEPSSRRDPAE